MELSLLSGANVLVVVFDKGIEKCTEYLSSGNLDAFLERAHEARLIQRLDNRDVSHLLIEV